MKLTMYQIDAFASLPFTGNPAAVVFYDSDLDERTMQSIAAENNLSETAFVRTMKNGYSIRWFTPTIEVALCGHATLAAAHALFEFRGCEEETISFHSHSEILPVRKRDGLLWLDFPSDHLERLEPSNALNQALGVPVLEVYRGREDRLAIVADEDEVASLKPDMTVVSELPARGLIVSSQGKAVDFVSRFFAPQYGIPEDPVTGSAHTSLVPYWSKRLNKEHLIARQLSSRRGELHCINAGERIHIGGRAVTFMSGEIII